MSRKNRNRPPGQTKSPKAPESPADPGSGHILRRTIMRTSEAIWLTGVPALFFVGLMAVLAWQDPALRTALTPQAIDALLNKWLFVAYFTVTAILAYNVYEDYGDSFRKRLLLQITYLVIFLTFANTLIAFLLAEMSAWKSGGKPVTVTVQMAISYTFSVVALFCYSLFREAELATGKPAAPVRQDSTAQPRPALTLKLVQHVAPHVRDYWLPALVTIVLTWAFVFGLRSDSLYAEFIAAFSVIASLVFPAYSKLTRK